MVNLIGGHFSKNGVQPQWPARGILSYGGHGLGEQHSDTIVVWRDAGIDERPSDLYTNPAPMSAIAQYWYATQFLPRWSEARRNHRIDYFTVTNEAVGSNPDELVKHIAYERELCRLAQEDGFKLVIGKMANGTPTFDLWVQYYAPWIVEAFNEYGAIYGRHIYGGGDLVASDGTVSKELPNYPSRIIDELEYLRSLNYHGGIFLCEVGLDGGYGVADWQRFHFQITKFEQALRPYADIVIGFAWWECGATNWQADYTSHLKQMTGYMSDNSLPKWEPGEVQPPMDKHKAIIIKYPQDASLAEMRQGVTVAYELRHTITQSHDDTRSLLLAGNPESYVKFAYPDRDRDTIAMVEELGFAWRSLFDDEPQPPQPPPTTGQLVSIRKYFEPENGAEYGPKIVFRWNDGRTQPQQLKRLDDGSIALLKGDGQWIGGQFYQDYERWSFDDDGSMCRHEDTSGDPPYTQHGAIWLRATVEIGKQYKNTPYITQRSRTCELISEGTVTDYLTPVALHKTWASPQNTSIVLNDVLEIIWQKSPDGPVIERYFLAPGMAYCAWNDAAIHEITQGQQNLSFTKWGCI